MTGQLCVFNQTEPRQSHVNLIFSLDRGVEELRFRDIRRFGSADLFPSQLALNEFFESRDFKNIKKTRRNFHLVLNKKLNN